MALTQLGRHSTLIHHSDRGLQYCCGDYTSMLVSNGIGISMTEKGDPYENAIAERVNGILKHEFDIIQRFKSLEEAECAICKAIQTYNGQRPHSSCNYLTPDEAHRTKGLLMAKWRQK